MSSNEQINRLKAKIIDMQKIQFVLSGFATQDAPLHVFAARPASLGQYAIAHRFG
jgi:hypothetical protein